MHISVNTLITHQTLGVAAPLNPTTRRLKLTYQIALQTLPARARREIRPGGAQEDFQVLLQVYSGWDAARVLSRELP